MKKLLTILLFSLLLPNVTNNGAEVSIAEDVTVSVTGDLILNSGNINVSGYLYVSGDIIQDGGTFSGSGYINDAPISLGDLNAKVPLIETDNELKKLNQNFNSMIDKLKKQQDKLLISERYMAWENVARKLAHEIKNPLTPIRLGAERLINRLNSHKKIDINFFPFDILDISIFEYFFSNNG